MAYLPLSTANLPDPVIDPAQGASPEDYFNTVLYTGNATDNHQIIGVGFQPDFLWIKQRNGTEWHNVQDVVRGVQQGLFPNDTYQEVTRTNAVKSFDTDGFTLGNSSGEGWNTSGGTYVAWNWKANGSGVSNTDGSITSTVSANTTSGFSVVSWNTGSTGQNVTIGHGLDSAPELIINQNRSVGGNWWTYSAELGATDYLILNSTQAAGYTDTRIWANTAPTSTVFSTEVGYVFPASSHDIISYCFHSVEGFSKLGSYVGNGSTDGPFVYTGFRPAFVMVKSSSAGEHWNIPVFTTDTNGSMNTLSPNLSNAERTMDQNPAVDFVSNGFKIRTSDANYNSNGGSYIYMAFAEDGGPFKYSRAR